MITDKIKHLILLYYIKFIQNKDTNSNMRRRCLQT